MSKKILGSSLVSLDWFEEQSQQGIFILKSDQTYNLLYVGKALIKVKKFVKEVQQQPLLFYTYTFLILLLQAATESVPRRLYFPALQ